MIRMADLVYIEWNQPMLERFKKAYAIEDQKGDRKAVFNFE